jgi:5'-3' exonuclease
LNVSTYILYERIKTLFEQTDNKQFLDDFRKFNCNINILRYNQYINGYDYVNISSITTNIYNYVCNNMIEYILKKTVLNDIIFLFTLFGNDFIPKIESINPKNDMDTIIQIYCLTIKKSKKKFIVYETIYGLQRINYFTFTNFIKEISNIEEHMLNEIYLSNKYKNYNFYKRQLGVSQLFPILQEYIIMANKLFDFLRNNIICNNIDDVINNIVNQYSDNIDFISKFIFFEENCSELPTENIIEKFKLLIQSYCTNKKEIKGNILLKKNDYFDIDKKFHKKNISDLFVHPMMEICEFDIESYKLEKKMGEYKIKLNAGDLDLGSIKLTTDLQGNYLIKKYSKQNTIKNYYKTYFNVDFDINQKNNKIIIPIVEDYLRGLFWTFDNYFNKNNSSAWTYEYHRSPLLYQIKEILFDFIKLKNNSFIEQMNQLYYSVTNCNDQPMNKIEHYIYVTPLKLLQNLPEKYINFIKENNDFFCDLDDIAEKIWSSKDNSDVIDCKRIPYLNKCNLMSIKFVKLEHFMNKIIKLRD